jgi:3-phosphoshikimate 1-carboxyvinyltransferase
MGQQTLGRVRRLVGEIVVPGELAPAERAVVLGALSPGLSVVSNTPPAVGRVLKVLRQLSIDVELDERQVRLRSNGLQGLGPGHEPVDMRELGDIRQALIGALAAQPCSCRLRLGALAPDEERLLECLAAMGAGVRRESEGSISVDGRDGLTGVDHDAAGLTWSGRLGLLLAGLGAQGSTALLEPTTDRSRVERDLRYRGVAVECRRDEAERKFRVAIGGGQTLAPTETTLAGDLLLAYPFMVIASARRGSELTLRRLAVRSETRGFLDLLRQIGASIEVSETEDDASDVAVAYSKQLRSTRVAGRRAERTRDQAPLVAILATQCPGEFVIRELQLLRSGDVDLVAHIHTMLKLLGARVGEYPEGLVIKGGAPLGGAALDSLEDAQMAMAWATAGALAHGETQVTGTNCLDDVYPDFFAALESVKE